MGLSDEQLRDALRSCPHDAVEALRVRWLYAKDFARAVEAKVRKQDDALILQLVEALENSHAALWEEDDDPARPVHAAISAGRARLEGKQ